MEIETEGSWNGEVVESRDSGGGDSLHTELLTGSGNTVGFEAAGVGVGEGIGAAVTSKSCTHPPSILLSSTRFVVPTGAGCSASKPTFCC